MALRALMLRKKIDSAKKELERAKENLQEILKREAELETAIEEAAEADEEAKAAVEEEVEKFEEEKAKAEEEVANLDAKVQELEEELKAEEEELEEEPAEEEEAETRKENKKMEVRKFFNVPSNERDAMFEREDVKAFLQETRSAMMEKRAISNVGLLIPEVFLGVLRENIINFSKLYKHVTVKSVSGTARQIIMASYQEAIWTECCANLNEMSLGFYDEEFDCFKVGGYYAICNANLEDSDVALATEILTALGQGIGMAIDKAIIYGRNTTSNAKMPLGIVSRLAQTAQPTGYPATARPWVDLHTTNMLSIPANTKGVDLVAALLLDFGAAKGSYSRGEKVWVMNETTYSQLMAALLDTNGNGNIVAAINGTMPVVGGIIEVLPFMPDNIIVAGYFDLYTLVERAGREFATSEHVRFLADQTVMKGTARYDGAPTIAEGFVAIGINGTTPTATMTFAADMANV